MIAGQRLDRARAGRDETAAAAASAALAQAQHAADALAQRLIAQEQQLAADHVRLTEQALDQASRVFDAGLAASSALFGFPGADRRDPLPTRQTARLLPPGAARPLIWLRL
jgi:hypothetical protein